MRWVVENCGVCALTRPNATKPIIQPIVVNSCLERIQIDPMDMRLMKDGEFLWILQIKDHFSCYMWLHALKLKKAAPIAEIMSTWFMYNGYPEIL